jgi:hypothetical protein
MQLPGGLLCDGELRRDFRFRTITGELERAIMQSGLHSNNWPQQVTLILVAALEQVAGQAADARLLQGLSAGDRQFLMLQLAALIDASPNWYTVNCVGCGEAIQFQTTPGNLPVKPAGVGYPKMLLQLDGQPMELRVPCGVDETFIAEHDGDDALEALLQRLLSRPGSQQPVQVHQFSQAGRETIDQALDEMSPQVGLQADVACPYCARQQQAEIDPYAWVVRETTELDQDIHTIAWHYHWSEQAILHLTRNRRAAYVQMIDRARGRFQADDLLQGLAG